MTDEVRRRDTSEVVDDVVENETFVPDGTVTPRALRPQAVIVGACFAGIAAARGLAAAMPIWSYPAGQRSSRLMPEPPPAAEKEHS